MKCYLVEDHESMRFILKLILRRNFPAITDIGESDTAERALMEIPVFVPNIVLIDISLPGMDGIELIRRLHPVCRSLCMLVVTGHEIELYRQAAIDAGAHGIVSKSDSKALIEAIREIMQKSENGGCK
jgi:two-component system invasion response regulator UvrY